MSFLPALGVWGFNERYHAHIILLGLPLEEFLFFITVPYASIFTLQVIESYFPDFRLSMPLRPGFSLHPDELH